LVNGISSNNDNPGLQLLRV